MCALQAFNDPSPESEGRPKIELTEQGSTAAHLFQFSLRSRCTAMLAGLRTLIQTGHTGSMGAVHLLGHNAFSTEPASVREHRRTVFGDVFVEQDARLRIAQHARQRGLAVEEREIAQILTI